MGVALVIFCLYINIFIYILFKELWDEKPCLCFTLYVYVCAVKRKAGFSLVVELNVQQ